jgi:hypothetical protein
LQYGGLTYRRSGNLGDQIQSLAAEQFIPPVRKRFDRDSLNRVSENEKHLVILNGWFSHHPENWPPSDAIIPVFFGFHIADDAAAREHLLSERSLRYLRRHEPIGCRDLKTRDLLAASGIDAYYSKCLTLTFPRRTSEPERGEVFLVDADRSLPVPKRLRRGAERLSHAMSDFFDDEIKLAMARDLLRAYRERARLVITTRLHCALPCIAMGIPVVFFGKAGDYRISLLKDMGAPVYPKPSSAMHVLLHVPLLRGLARQWLRARVNWDPSAINIEEEKGAMIQRLKEAIRLAAERSSSAQRFV